MAAKRRPKIPAAKLPASGGSIVSPKADRYLTKLVEAHQQGGSTDGLQPHVSFKFFDANFQCPSSWQPAEFKGLMNSLRLLCEMTWQQVKQTGGKGSGANNAGLRYKSVDPPMELPKYFSEDVQVVEMGCSDKARFMGVREDATFYLIWLDRNHDVFKS